MHNKEVVTPPFFIAKILKVPVFRLSLGQDIISRICIFCYNFFSKICSRFTKSFSNFDPKIAQRSLERFSSLGADVRFVTPRDGKGKIQMMTFKAMDLEKNIAGLGGSWKRVNLQGKEVLAILPPENQSKAWLEFKEKLKHFRWKEEEGMLITCNCADVIPENSPKKCFLFAHTTSSAFISDWERAGLYIGAKQDLCFFDNGNTWKNTGRAPSEESFYLEIEAVYEIIKDLYPPQHLWIGGSCGGAPLAAYMKRRLHHQGVNCFIEKGFADMDDFVKPISPFFAPLVKGSLKSQDLPEDMVDRPPSCQFSAEKLWQPLSQYQGTEGGKVIIVHAENDDNISQGACDRYLNLAKKVSSKVKYISYNSTSKWRHGGNFFVYETPKRQFMQYLFE